MKNIFLSPLIAPLFCLFFIPFIFILGEITTIGINPMYAYRDGGIVDCITYFGYILALGTLVYFQNDFKGKRLDYFLFIFLLGCAVLREMGIQHYLTKTDTTAFKLRFFTNPNNPLSEKILAAGLLTLVFGIIAYLLFKYTARIIRGFFKLNPLYWTVCTLGGIGIFAKFADRFPSNYFKMTHVHFSDSWMYFFTVLEESGESTFPILVALGVIQYHILKHKSKKA